MAAPVILLEFNELTPTLMDRFIAQGHLPGFKRLRDESIIGITDAEEAPPALEPWIQWVTVHTGLSFAEHGVYDLGEGENFRAPRIWDLVAAAGETAWVCGSMNATVQNELTNSVYLLPDPWAVNLRPRPAGTFDHFYHYVRTYVQEYTRERPPLSAKDHAQFLKFMLLNGLSVSTASLAATQLAGEKLRGTPRWKRAVILDRLLWDVFRRYYKRLRPRFSTFFLNSTAHFQHYYWRDMEPDAFDLRPPSADSEKQRAAILTGYRMMDKIVQECLQLAGDDATIVLCTALGQQAMTKYDQQGGKQIFKPRDPTVLLRFAGIHDSFKYSPVMAEQFHLFFESETAAREAEEKLAGLRLGGAPVMELRREGIQIFAGCAIIHEPQDGTEITTPFSNKKATFDMLFYPVEGLKSGMHHPDGLLWIRTPARVHKSVPRKISLREVAPTLARLAGAELQGSFTSPPISEVM